MSEYICRYTAPGHYTGMAQAPTDRYKIITDKWGLPAYFATVADAEQAFADVLAREEKYLDGAAKAANGRNPSKTVGDYRTGIASIRPKPHSPEVLRLVRVSDNQVMGAPAVTLRSRIAAWWGKLRRV